MDIIKAIEHEQLKDTVPVLDVGNTVRVSVKIKEGEKERIQVFEGIIIKKQGGGLNETFTVRKISYGVGVEKTFLVHSPMVEKVEVVRVGKARRAKLNYLRDRIGKDAKTKERVGARIENKVVVLKEALEEAEAESVDETVEAPAQEAVETADVVETVVATEVVETAETAEVAEATEEVAEVAETAETVESTEVAETTEEVTGKEENTDETTDKKDETEE